MKKIIVSLLAVIYLSFSAGATLYLHYCMGEYVNFSLFDATEKSCGKCGMKKHSDNTGCCKNVPVSVKITDAHKGTGYIAFIPSAPALHLPEHPVLEEISPVGAQLLILVLLSYYPPGSTHRVYLICRNLRI